MSDVPPVSTETLLRDTCDELERRLRAGEAVRAEEFFARHPTIGHDPELAMDLIYVEYATRRERGETPPREEFFTRFPQWHDQLERQFKLDEFMTRKKGTGVVCAKHPPGRRGKRLPSPFSTGGFVCYDCSRAAASGR